jgi:signal transduction histidine kinase
MRELHLFAIACTLEGSMPQALFFGEVRTRLLVFYGVMLSVLIGITVPISKHLLLLELHKREATSLGESIQDFSDYMKPVLAAEAAPTSTELAKYMKSFLTKILPEDDTFFIIVINGEFQRSSPVALPEPMRQGSVLMRKWEATTRLASGRVDEADPEVGTILYSAVPVEVGGRVQAVFVAARTTAGELAEVGDFTSILIQIVVGILLTSLFFLWILSKAVLAPLQLLANTTRSITATNLKQRLPVTGRGELGDITLSFNAMMDRLEALIISQKEFIQDAGHELRTPITVIRGNIELLLQDDDEEARRETVRLVLDEVDRIARLVQELSLLAQYQRPEFLVLTDLDVHRFTQDIYQKASVLAPRRWSLACTAQIMMEADEQRLTQCMMNLALNATQHTSESDRIEIGSSLAADGSIRIWVSDSGEGIPERIQKHVFNRFFKGKSRAHAEHHSGLGLSIVRAIVNAHHGRIELFSQPMHGTTLTLFFPKRQPVLLRNFSPEPWPAS